ncbi:MAG: hypothetical protein FJ272_00965 [Planctomycetes bacterium]|nr:hypothetical protein [Planctomycetota bacterium]
METSAQTRWRTATATRDVESAMLTEPKHEYLRPNRYFRFFLFKEKLNGTTCWLPEGFLV